ncbi:hypothetical protein [Leifsonia shinshuensis]|uniref:Uncharacterized protein n=1 Tax=Leifsonia shinshuensis TaxID=150026 RepID=A0A7G6YBL7_9MICO|nr:hypothetical protein [Leifsonia shinshuensis]QNE35882.1 hypothetical protein F1C12_12590 [Leifsonia shinshuensis]
MIASLLPGFRDFRTPLVVGYLWLMAVWVLVSPFIPKKADSIGLLRALYDLTGWLGTTIALTILTFAAYVIGLILSGVSLRLLQWGGQQLAPTTEVGLADLIDRKLSRIFASDLTFADVERQLPNLAEEADDFIEFEHDRQRRIGSDEFGRMEGPPSYEKRMASRDMSRRNWLRSPRGHEAISRRVLNELRLAELSLQISSKDVYDKYDRTRSEADFRHAIAAPIGVLGIAVAVRLGFDGLGLWATLIAFGSILVVGVLELTARRREREANDFIVQAIIRGVIKAPVLELLDEVKPAPSIEASSKRR